MKALYDLDQTIVRIVPKWVRLAFDKEPGLARKIAAKVPDYEDSWADVDKKITDYRMDLFFDFNAYENHLFCACMDECKDFYQEFTGIDIPRFGIEGVEEIVVISQSDEESRASRSKKELLEEWKRRGKIADWLFTSSKLHNKATVVANVFKDYDFMAEDHPRYPIQVCKTLSGIKIHLVEYPYNKETMRFLRIAFPERLIGHG